MDTNELPTPITPTEAVDEKIVIVQNTPGLSITFNPDEADEAGAFQEDAISSEEADDAALDDGE